MSTFAVEGKPVSIKDIAKLARVSHSTVSRALQNNPLVNAKTAERIRKIARESGYTASAVARSLVTKKTLTIGVVVTTIEDPFIGDVVSGVEQVANDHGYSVLLAQSQADPEREMRVVQSFHERRVDGILVTASRVGALYLPMLSGMKVPVVLINNQYGDFCHSVLIENVEAAREATRHLVKLGHKRIAYIGDQFGYQSDTERMTGYRQALEEADLPFRPELVVHGDGKPQGGGAAAKKLLSLAARPTAIFCYNDQTAFGALRTIRTRGLSVPDDISLVGFDDLYFAPLVEPPLTTIRQPKEKMGRKGMEILLSLMSGAKFDKTVKVSGTLIVRNSTAPPSASGGGVAR